MTKGNRNYGWFGSGRRMHVVLTEAFLLNQLWDFATKRLEMTGHRYYCALGMDMRAFVRGYK